MKREALLSIILVSGLALLFTSATMGQGVTDIELLQNGGFEAGHAIAPWVTDSKNGNGMIIGGQGGPNGPHAGNRLCKLGGSNREVDILRQQVLVPLGATALTLSFWAKVKATGNDKATGDYLSVTLVNTLGQTVETPITLSNLDDGKEWVYREVAMAPHGGLLLDLIFTAGTDETQPTAFYLDDISLKYSMVPGTPGSPQVLIVNPRTGCTEVPLPPQPEFVIGGSTTISAIGASASGIASMKIFVDGNLVATNSGENRLDAILGANALAPGAHEVVAEITDMEGLSAACPVLIRASDIIDAGDMEGSAADFYWKQTTLATAVPQPGEQPVMLSDVDLARSPDGFARLGGAPNRDQTLSQYLPVADDATGTVTVSFYYSISTEKTGTAVADTLDVQLKTLSSGAVTTIKSFSNLSANDSWALCQITLAVGTDVVAGGEYELQFHAVTSVSTSTTTFDIDDVSVWVMSQKMAIDPLGVSLNPWERDITLEQEELLEARHAAPPYCSGQSGLNECTSPIMEINSGIRFLGNCLTGMDIRFRVTYGGITKQSEKAVVLHCNAEAIGTIFQLICPTSPFPDKFTPATIVCQSLDTGETTALPWRWDPIGLREYGFRYGYEGRPDPVPPTSRSEPVFSSGLRSPFTLWAINYQTFKSPDGRLFYPSAFIRDDQALTPGGNTELTIPLRVTSRIDLQHYDALFTNKGAPSLCAQTTPCIRTTTFFMKLRNPGLDFMEQSQQEHLTGWNIGVRLGVQPVSWDNSLMGYGEGVLPTCSNPDVSLVRVTRFRAGRFLRLLNVRLGTEPLSNLRLFKVPGTLLGDMPASPCNCCVDATVESADTANSWVSPSFMFGYALPGAPCPACGL